MIENTSMLSLAKAAVKQTAQRLADNNKDFGIIRVNTADDGEDILLFLTTKEKKTTFVVHPMNVISPEAGAQIINYLADGCETYVATIMSTMKPKE